MPDPGARPRAPPLATFDRASDAGSGAFPGELRSSFCRSYCGPGEKCGLRPYAEQAVPYVALRQPTLQLEIRPLKSTHGETAIKHHNCMLSPRVGFGSQRDLPVFDSQTRTRKNRSNDNFRIASGKRIVDKTRSQVSQPELETIYNIDSMTEEDFLKYNYPQLLQLLTGGNGTRRRWLPTYLKTCSNSPEKRRLTQPLTPISGVMDVHSNRRRQRSPTALPARDS